MLSRGSGNQNYQKILLGSVSVEATKLISLVSIVGGANVGVIGDHKVVLSHLVLHLRNYGTGILLGDLGQLSSFQKIFIILLL